MTTAVNKEVVIGNILQQMNGVIEFIHLQMLENVIRENLNKVRLEEEETALSTMVDDNIYMIKLFISTKGIEGLKKGSLEQYYRENKRFLEEVDKNYRNVTKDDVKIYLARRGVGLKRNTLANCKRYLSTFYGWLHDEGYIERNPVKTIKGLKPTQVENKYLSIDEEIAVREYPKTLQEQAVISFLLSTGVRVGEVEAMCRDNVNFAENTVTFRGEKGDKWRTVPLDARAKWYLRQYLASRTDSNPALFISARKNNGEAIRLPKSGFQRIVHKVCEGAGIQRVCTVHVLRKTFATRLADKGCSLETIQELLGHADAGTTSKYYVARSVKRLKNEYEKIMDISA